MTRPIRIDHQKLLATRKQLHLIDAYHIARAALAVQAAAFAEALHRDGQAVISDDTLSKRVAELDEATWRARAVPLADAAAMCGVAKVTLASWLTDGELDLRHERRGNRIYVCLEDAILRTLMAAEED